MRSGPLFSRRRVLGCLTVALTVPLIAASPETLIKRKATFNEMEGNEVVGRWIRMQLGVSDLLKTSDKQAMQNLDSGFATRLVYDLILHETGNKAALAAVHIEVRVLWNPWNREYEVETRVDGGKASLRRFSLRDDAIEAATRIEVRIAPSSSLVRGKDQATYYVHVIAQRNPIQSKTAATATTARGQDRDLEMFSRWVGMFVRSRPKADQTVEFRTNSFYLVERDDEDAEPREP